MMGKAKAQQRLIDNLEEEFAKVLNCLNVCLDLISAGDFLGRNGHLNTSGVAFGELQFGEFFCVAFGQT